MAIHLFPHNKTAYESAVAMLSERGKAAVIHPTGTGKSFIGFKLCEDNPDKTICWLSPSRYIYQTQLENLAGASDGYQPENVKFYTYAKLMLLSDAEIADIKPDFIILDEFHRCGAELWGEGVDKLLRAYPDAKILGLSATAIRYLDNQRDMSDELFDGNVASSMTLGEAIVRGILNPPKYILSIYSYQKDLEKYEQRVQRSRYKAIRDEANAYLDALRRSLDKAEKLDVLFAKHMEDCSGKYIVFCANIEHMDEMIDKATEWFSKVDKKPHIYRAYSNDPETSKAFADFKSDTSEHLKLLYCIDMLNEGVHVDDVSGVILLRPTISPIIYKQQIGRALSASKSKNPVIFDIVNNIENLCSIDTVKEEMQLAIQYYRSHGGEGLVVNERFELIDRAEDCRSLFEALEGTLSASWDMMYEKAKEYYKQNGSLEMTNKYVTEDGYNLGMWLQTQRMVYRGTRKEGKLTQVQIDKLNEIGMRWEIRTDLSWEIHLSAAKKYHKKFGDISPVVSYIDDDGVHLGQWIASLRTNRRNGFKSNYLTEERIAALDKLGMVWEVYDYWFEEYFASAVRYHQQHGNLDMPAKYVDKNGLKLGMWLNSIRSDYRKNKSNLSDEQKKRLESIGVEWRSKAEVTWANMYTLFCNFIEQNGSADVPIGYISDNGKKLGEWVSMQRYYNRHGKLTDERKKLLDSVGMLWERESVWDTYYNAAREYYNDHGNLYVRSDFEYKGVPLGRWVFEQKKNIKGKRSKRFTQEQADKLKLIGIGEQEASLSKNDISWQKNYLLAKEYFVEHGDLEMPKGYSTNGVKLYVWVVVQRRKRNEGKLTDEQIRLLDEIGMEWLSSVDKAWEIGFKHFEEYVREYGTADISKGYASNDGYALYNWFLRQRQNLRNGKLKPEQEERLTKLGVDKRTDEDVWNEHISEVKAYMTENNAGYIPQKYPAADGTNLYEWLRTQCKKYAAGTLSKEKMQMLDELGYPFSGKERNLKIWLENYSKALDYLSQHEGERITPDVVCDGLRLKQWIANQKQNLKKGKLSDEQKELLAKIGVN